MILNYRSAASFGVAALLVACCLLAEEERVALVGSESSVSTVADSDYRLGPGDVIEVSVFGVPDYVYSRRLPESGLIDLPLLGELDVQGKSAAAVRMLIKRRLSEGLILNPQVSVDVTEYRSRPTFVLGNVKHPGQFAITRPTQLVDLIGMAGGLTEAAGEVALVRCAKAGREASQPGDVPDGDALRVPLAPLLDGVSGSINVLIKGGCVVRIPERRPDYYYVVGSVVSAGRFELEDDQPMRLTRALANAGGPLNPDFRFGG